MSVKILLETPNCVLEQLSRFDPYAESLAEKIKRAPEVYIIVPYKATEEHTRQRDLVTRYAGFFDRGVRIFNHENEADIYALGKKERPFIYKIRDSQMEILEEMEYHADLNKTIVLHPRRDVAYAIKMYIDRRRCGMRQVIVVGTGESEKLSDDTDMKIYDSELVYPFFQGAGKAGVDRNVSRIHLIRLLKRKALQLK